MAEQAKEERDPSREHIIGNQVTDLLKDSIGIVTEYRCKYHPRHAATAICEFCKADLCFECTNIRGHRFVCDGCMSSADKALAGTGPAAFMTNLLTHPYVVALVLAVLLGSLFVSLGNARRKGALGEVPATAVGAEDQFRLKMLLYTRKANRIETLADSLRESGSFEKGTFEYGRARVIYEDLIGETDGRWEQPVLNLARARILEQMGESAYAEGLYAKVADLPGVDKTYPVIALFRLAKLQTKSDPEKAVETYKEFLSDVKYVPDSLDRTLDVMGHTEKAYRYKSRLCFFTRTEFDFEEAKVEALLKMGRLLLALGRESEGRYRLSLAAQGSYGAEMEEQVRSELRRLRAVDDMESLPVEEEKEEEDAEEEEVVITHFD